MGYRLIDGKHTDGIYWNIDGTVAMEISLI
jgi:hypothetical protein